MKTEEKTECKYSYDGEVCVENDEYEREQQRLAKQIKHMVILRNDHISCSVWFENALTFSNSFNIIHMLCLPSQTCRTSCTCMIDCPKSTCHAY